MDRHLQLVLNEIDVLVCVMSKRNTKWGREEDIEKASWYPLLRRLQKLESSLAVLKSFDEIDLEEFLSPFLEIIRSDETSGYVTYKCLTSLHKFIIHNVVANREDGEVASSFDLIADAVAHAKFFGTDPGSDEAVLMNILQVLSSMVGSNAGVMLSNDGVCKAMQSCFHICFELRLSEMLRRNAAFTLTKMVCHLCSRMEVLRTSDDYRKDGENLREVSISFSHGDGKGPLKIELDEAMGSDEQEAKDETKSSPICTVGNAHELEENVSNNNNSSTKASVRAGYGVPALEEMFRFLIRIIDTHDSNNNENMILTGLDLLTAAFETCGKQFEKHHVLLALIKNELTKNLTQLLVSTRFTIFSSALRLSFQVLLYCRHFLKLQLEAILTRVIKIIVSESHAISMEHKECALHFIVKLWRIPDLLSEMYYNFDHDPYCQNLFEDLVRLLSKSSFPVDGRVTRINLLCIDALMVAVSGVEENCKQTTKRFGSSLLTSSLSDPLHAKVLSRHELLIIKEKKRIIRSGTEEFNKKPSKGIAYLQENHVLNQVLDPLEVVTFIKQNPWLDKSCIADYISNRKNIDILNAFVGSFNFKNVRIDEALREFLEAFRLPGEAPLISHVLERFAEVWSLENNEPFANCDAAFTLAYAIIMLNTDQHNTNAKKTTIPMTVEDFKRNLSGVNGGQNFDSDLLQTMYEAIKSNEIVMPEERSGAVRDDYLWRLLQMRSKTPDGFYEVLPAGCLDNDIYAILWGPCVASLVYVCDKTDEEEELVRILNGFRSCASVAAHFVMSDVFDNIIISLTKCIFKSLPKEESFVIGFASSAKAALATQSVFDLTRAYGDMLRAGWKNIIEMMLCFFVHRLLPDEMMESHDFVSGRIKLIRNATAPAKRESSLLSAFYSYLSDNSGTTHPTDQSEEFARDKVAACVRECNVQQLVKDSKFLVPDSLTELFRALLSAIRGDDESNEVAHFAQQALNCASQDDISAFCTEILVRVLIENRDRVEMVWMVVNGYFEEVLLTQQLNQQALSKRAIASNHEAQGRVVVAILRLAVRLLFKEELADLVMKSLCLLLRMPLSILFKHSRQVSSALHELVQTNYSSVKLEEHWAVVFSLLEFSGAAVRPNLMCLEAIFPGTTHLHNRNYSQATIEPSKPAIETQLQRARSDPALNQSNYDANTSSLNAGDTDRGYTSDNERAATTGNENLSESPTSTWVVVGKEGETEDVKVASFPDAWKQQDGDSIKTSNMGKELRLKRDIWQHDSVSFFKALESVAFLLQDPERLTRCNIRRLVLCVRCFAEAALYGSNLADKQREMLLLKQGSGKSKAGGNAGATNRRNDSPSNGNVLSDALEESEKLCKRYDEICVKLMEYMYVVHCNASKLYDEANGSDWAEQVWNDIWFHVLHGMARMCCNRNKYVRTAAINFFQRALLLPEMQLLQAETWYACYYRIFFPLLAALVDEAAPADQEAFEETRVRAFTLVGKVYLQHLSALSKLSTFPQMWAYLLAFMKLYTSAANSSDILQEAIAESLKNMLLVMHTSSVFQPRGSQYDDSLWLITSQRVEHVFPGLLTSLFNERPTASAEQQQTPICAQNMHQQAQATAQPANQNTPRSVTVPIPVPSRPEHPDYAPRPIPSAPDESLENADPISTANSKPNSPTDKTNLIPQSSNSFHSLPLLLAADAGHPVAEIVPAQNNTCGENLS